MDLANDVDNNKVDEDEESDDSQQTESDTSSDDEPSEEDEEPGEEEEPEVRYYATQTVLLDCHRQESTCKSYVLRTGRGALLTSRNETSETVLTGFRLYSTCGIGESNVTDRS